MTPKELRLKTRAMGIQATDLARIFDYDRRTIQRWYKTHMPPAVVEDWINTRWEAFLQEVCTTVASVREISRVVVRDELWPDMSVKEREHLMAAVYLCCAVERIEVDFLES